MKDTFNAIVTLFALPPSHDLSIHIYVVSRWYLYAAAKHLQIYILFRMPRS